MKKYRVIFSGDKYALQVWVKASWFNKAGWKEVFACDNVNHCILQAQHLSKEGTIVWESEV